MCAQMCLYNICLCIHVFTCMKLFLSLSLINIIKESEKCTLLRYLVKNTNMNIIYVTIYPVIELLQIKLLLQIRFFLCHIVFYISLFFLPIILLLNFFGTIFKLLLHGMSANDTLFLKYILSHHMNYISNFTYGYLLLIQEEFQ